MGFVKLFSLMYGYNSLLLSWINELFTSERLSKRSLKQDIFGTAEYEYKEALSLVMMLIWNILTINQKNQKHKSETWYGLTRPLTNTFQQSLQRRSVKWKQNISKKPQTSQNFEPQFSWSQLKLQERHVKNHHNKVTSKPRDQTPKYNCRKKAECPMKGNCQVNIVVYKCGVTRVLP